MKKFELYIAIAIFIITTFLIITIPMSFEYSNGLLALVCFISAAGYIAGYLVLENYLSRHEMHHYFKGFDDATSLYAHRPKQH
jgi:hypothetical protein